MRVNEIVREVPLPQGVLVTLDQSTVSIKGPKGEVHRIFALQKISIEKKENALFIRCPKPGKKDHSCVGSFEAHLKNMILGVTSGFHYKLKICSSHFPMNVAISGQDFVVKNLFGEKVPRSVKIRAGASVKIEGQDVNVEGIDKDIVGQMAADIEQLTKITERDRRIFQDGIYIVEKKRETHPMKPLLTIRKTLKRKKPNFLRQDSHKFSGLKSAWRKPKGITAKILEKI